MFHSKNEKLVEEVLREERVRFLCRSPPVTVSRSIPLSEVVELLRQEAAACVVVVESDDDGEDRPAEVDEASASRPRPVGIFTERDYLDKLVTLEPADWLNVKYNPVERHMTANLKLLSMDAPLGKAIQLMTEGSTFGFDKALELGLVNEIYESEDRDSFLASVLEYAAGTWGRRSDLPQPWSVCTPTAWFTTICPAWTTTSCAEADPPVTWSSAMLSRCWLEMPC